MNSSVLTLDIGTSKIAALSARPKAKGGLEPVGSCAVPCTALSKGEILDKHSFEMAVIEAVNEAEKQSGLKSEKMLIGIAGTSIKVSTTQGILPIYPSGRSVTREDVLQALKHSRQLPIDRSLEQIQALPREFQIDGRRGISQPVGMPASELQVATLLVAAPSAHMRMLEGVAERCGKSIDQVALTTLGSGIAVLTRAEIDGGVCVIDIGAASTEVGLFVNGSMADADYLPVGSRHVTSDIATLLKCSPEDAEQLKRVSGIAMGRLAEDGESVDVLQVGIDQARPMQRKVLGEIIESRLREIAKLAQKRLSERGHDKLMKHGIVLTGGGSQLIGTEDLFSEAFKGIHVRVAQPGTDMKIEDGWAFTSAIGLAKFCLQNESDELVTAEGTAWKDKIRTLWSLFAPTEA